MRSATLLLALAGAARATPAPTTTPWITGDDPTMPADDGGFAPQPTSSDWPRANDNPSSGKDDKKKKKDASFIETYWGALLFGGVILMVIPSRVQGCIQSRTDKRDGVVRAPLEPGMRVVGGVAAPPRGQIVPAGEVELGAAPPDVYHPEQAPSTSTYAAAGLVPLPGQAAY